MDRSWVVKMTSLRDRVFAVCAVVAVTGIAWSCHGH